jgi:hypothetical protein|tara:strand:+ start:59 stop:409 length:351 start_codon:yes stop_codon:yes gene_type:complete
MGLVRELRNRRKVEPKRIEVAEWADEGGEPFVFYCYPITAYDMGQMQKKHPGFLSDMTLPAMVDLICMKATDESNERIFGTAEDRHDLMGEESAIVSEIAAQMFSTITSVEDQEKN